MSKDLYWNSVVLAMHMNDTLLTDGKGKTVALNGAVARSSSQSKFGVYSAYFDGNSSYLSVPYSSDFDFGAGDLTIEMWLYRTGTNANGSRFWNCGGDYYHQVELGIDASGNLVSYGSTNGVDWSAWSAPNIGAIPANTWTHVAVVLNGGTVTAYIDGSGTVLTSSLGNTVLVNGAGGASQRTIGGQSGINRGYVGYIDDLRITKGVARYTSNFTPPGEAFPDAGYEVSGSVQDLSSSPLQRVVRAYRRDNGAFLGETSSSPTTGAYTIPVAYDSEINVVLLDDTAGTLENDQVLRTTPV